MEPLKFKIIKSPVGDLKIVASDRALKAILWDNEKPNRVRLDQMKEDFHHSLILETERQLKEYFQKERAVFDLPLELDGTDFQRDVWDLLNKIDFGSISTYKEIAIKLRRPLAVRAVGTAIGRNPISIIVPCHRVIASDGGLGGFAGGLDRKKILLAFESKKY